MNLTNKVLSDSVASAVRLLLKTARSLAVIPIITNLLGAGSYGVWATVLPFIGLLSSVGGIHLHGSLVRYFQPNDYQTYSDILSLGLLVSSLLTACVVILGLWVDLSAIFDGEVASQQKLVLASAMLIGTNILLQINLNYPRAIGEIKLYEIGKISKLALETVFLIAVFLVGGTVTDGITGLVIISVILNIGILFRILRTHDLPWPNVTNYPVYLRYGIPMMPKAVSSGLLAHMDRYLILILISPMAAGTYAVGRGVSAFITNISRILNPTLYPSVSGAWEEDRIDEISNLYTEIIRYYLLIAIPAVVGLSYLAQPILTLISTPSISNNGWVLVPILGVGFLLRGIDNMLTYILTATEATQQIAKAVMIAACVNIPANLILIHEYGIIGAAIATVVAQSITFILIYRYATSEITFAVPWWSLGRSILAVGIMLTSLHYLPLHFSDVGKIIASAFIGSTIYATALVLIGEFTLTELIAQLNR